MRTRALNGVLSEFGFWQWRSARAIFCVARPLKPAAVAAMQSIPHGVMFFINIR